MAESDTGNNNSPLARALTKLAERGTEEGEARGKAEQTVAQRPPVLCQAQREFETQGGASEERRSTNAQTTHHSSNAIRLPSFRPNLESIDKNCSFQGKAKLKRKDLRFGAAGYFDFQMG